MRLRNKKTGEIVERVDITIREVGVVFNNDETYGSLAELNAEWEDAPEEPKEHWYINYQGEVYVLDPKAVPEYSRNAKSIGNYFETREEAEKAVEKLKALKRLKDKGFRIRRNNYHDGMMYLHIWNDTTDEPTPLNKNSETFKDLDLLFGGEE